VPCAHAEFHINTCARVLADRINFRLGHLRSGLRSCVVHRCCLACGACLDAISPGGTCSAGPQCPPPPLLALAPRVTLQEIAAGKDYPGGFSLLRLYTGGYELNLYRTRSELARRWSERGRQQILGRSPQFALASSVSDRNLVVARDPCGLHFTYKPQHHR
jgi:hypothetical protein